MTDTTDTGVVETPAPDANVPVETPVETPEVEQDVSDSSPDATDEGESSEKPRGGFQKRISELTRNWRETEREAARKAAEADYWREMALRNTRQEPDPQPDVPVAPAAPEPVKTLADFNYDEAKYEEYRDQRALTIARREAAEILRQERERETSQRRQQTFEERIASYAKATPDFDSVVRNPAVPITKQIVDIVSSLEDAPAILYNLGKNPEETARIARLDPVSAAREIGKIEARIAFEREQVSKPVVTPKPAVSQAPPPPPKIEAAEPDARKSIYDEGLSMRDWLALREKQVKRKG